MKGHVHILAADMLRLRDAIHEAGACSAWNQIRHMADPDLKVAHANDGNHWADWQAIAAEDTDCRCHARMGNDFYFLPMWACLDGPEAAKRCTDPCRAQPAHVTDKVHAPKGPVPYHRATQCHHHRLTRECPFCKIEQVTNGTA